MNQDFKREKSHKSQTTKELVLTQEDKAKYTTLYDFLLHDDEDDSLESPIISKKMITTDFRKKKVDSFSEIMEKYLINKNVIENDNSSKNSTFKESEKN